MNANIVLESTYGRESPRFDAENRHFHGSARQICRQRRLVVQPGLHNTAHCMDAPEFPGIKALDVSWAAWEAGRGTLGPARQYHPAWLFDLLPACRNQF